MAETTEQLRQPYPGTYPAAQIQMNFASLMQNYEKQNAKDSAVEFEGRSRDEICSQDSPMHQVLDDTTAEEMLIYDEQEDQGGDFDE